MASAPVEISRMWLITRLATCIVAIWLSFFCYKLYVLQAVEDFYFPNEPQPSFWLLWIPLVLVATYLLFVSASGRWRPARRLDWLLGPLLLVTVFAVLRVLEPWLVRTFY